MRLANILGKQYECDDYRTIIHRYVPELLTIIVVNSNEDKLIQKRFLKWLLIVNNEIQTRGIFQPGLKETTLWIPYFLKSRRVKNTFVK